MPLLVYFLAPVRVAPRRLLDGRAHTGRNANKICGPRLEKSLLFATRH